MRTRPRSHRRGGSRTRRDTAPGRPSRRAPRQSRVRAFQKSGRPPQQRVARVRRRLFDDVVQQPLKDMSKLGPGTEAELEQVVAVDGEVREPVRALLLVPKCLPEPLDLLEIRKRRLAVLALAAEVGLLVVDELEGELVAVFREEASCT